MVIKFISFISYRRLADARNYAHQFHFHHLISVARRYQGTIVINFNYIILYRRPADTNGIQRHRVGHLHSIGGSTPPIGGLLVNPLSHCPADTVLSANTALPRCALNLIQLSLLRSSKLCPFHNADRKATENASLSMSAQCARSLSCTIT